MKEKRKRVERKKQTEDTRESVANNSSDDDYQPLIKKIDEAASANFPAVPSGSRSAVGSVYVVTSGSNIPSNSTATPSPAVRSISTATSSSAVGSRFPATRSANVPADVNPVQELEPSENFDLKNFINKGFFVEVFLSLVDKRVHDGTLTGKSRLRDSVKRYRQLIAKHKDDYIKYADYTPPKFVNSQQPYLCSRASSARYFPIQSIADCLSPA
ncbi:hypothetical protein EDC94DRAFT_665526 [Helicostylum pulchrum]|nr:hypothetical protein EDC94DRAFT_665526 [Helicostylum pulchrum]